MNSPHLSHPIKLVLEWHIQHTVEKTLAYCKKCTSTLKKFRLLVIHTKNSIIGFVLIFVTKMGLLSATGMSSLHDDYYSNLPNKRTGTMNKFWGKTLIDVLWIFLISEKQTLLIDLIPGFTSYRGLGIKAINWNHFHCSKIITKHQSRFFCSNFGNRTGMFIW